MLNTINHKKLLILTLVLLVLWSTIASLSVKAESTQTDLSQAEPTHATTQLRFSDVPDSVWYAETINTWIALGILDPTKGNKLNPQVEMTRGSFARYLAISLDLTPSKSNSTYKDMPAGDELTGYVTALQEKGLVGGYTDGTFRPNAKITRAEVASFIVKAKKLSSAPEVASQFSDADRCFNSSWYRYRKVKG